MSSALRAWILCAAVAAAGGALAQKPPQAELAALSHIESALATGADPRVMAREVALGPELQRRLGLPARAEGARVYEAVVALVANKPVEVRRSTAADIAAYGARPGLEPVAQIVAVAEAGELRLLLQYDPRATAVSYVGELGAEAPRYEPRSKPKPKPRATPKPQ